MRTLIAFYSRAGENYFHGAYRRIPVGNTEKVAKLIAALTGGSLFKIEQQTPYSDVYKECIEEAKKDLEQDKRPSLLSLPEDFDQYDEIYLGYPNYWGTMPMAVYTFLENLNWKGKTIHPFCTHEGSGLSNTEKDIKKAVPEAVVTDGLAIFGSRAEISDNAVKTWISGFNHS